MNIDTSITPLGGRDITALDYSDITAAVWSGEVIWDDSGTILTLPFTPEVVDLGEQRLILLRLQSQDPVEEERAKRARAALGALKQIREGTSSLTAQAQLRLMARILVALIIRVFRLRDDE